MVFEMSSFRSKKKGPSQKSPTFLDLSDLAYYYTRVLYDDGVHIPGLDFLHHRGKAGAVKARA